VPPFTSKFISPAVLLPLSTAYSASTVPLLTISLPPSAALRPYLLDANLPALSALVSVKVKEPFSPCASITEFGSEKLPVTVTPFKSSVIALSVKSISLVTVSFFSIVMVAPSAAAATAAASVA